jgi:tRNA-dihydrouridine synthase B
MTDEKNFLIGGVEVSNPIWLAPLAGVTTRAFRAFHRRAGAGLVHTEMISATGLLYKNKKTFRMIGGDSEPGPVVLQFFGPDALDMARAADIALKIRRFDVVEINMACPMPKVTKKCGGASLLMDPLMAGRMVSGLKVFGLPVWAKIRRTDDKIHPLRTEDFCGEMLAAGADLLIVHGRTPAQRYEGVADKEAVISAARKFPGFVAASGDFYAPEDAKYYLDGGCAAVLAARGVIKDAFLIPETLNDLGYAADEKYLGPADAERIEMLISAVADAKSSDGERHAMVMARRMLPGVLKGSRGVSGLRQSVASCGDWAVMERALIEFAELPG